MDINALVNMAATMFPNARVVEAVQRAQQMIQGTGNDLGSVQKKAHELGIDPNFVNQMYQRYANTPAAKMLCGMLGTSPDALKEDAMSIVGGSPRNNPVQNAPKNTPKFPRLK